MRCSNFITFHGHSGSRSPIINKAMGLKATQQTSSFSGLVGLEVVYWPLVAKFAGSHPTEAVGFLGRKNPQPSVPCRSFTACKRSLNVRCKRAFRQNYRTFLAHSSTLRRWVLSRGDTRGDAWWRKLERLNQIAQ